MVPSVGIPTLNTFFFLSWLSQQSISHQVNGMELCEFQQKIRGNSKDREVSFVFKILIACAALFLAHFWGISV